jgi:hypothetical protein
MRTLTAIAILCLCATPAFADDEHNHPPQDVPLHEQFYIQWKVPNGGNPRAVSCCNKMDCYPTAVRYDPVQKAWFALRREDHEWVVVHPEKLEQLQTDEEPSPDHQSHACIRPPQLGGQVVCATLGDEQKF